MWLERLSTRVIVLGLCLTFYISAGRFSLSRFFGKLEQALPRAITASQQYDVDVLNYLLEPRVWALILTFVLWRRREDIGTTIYTNAFKFAAVFFVFAASSFLWSLNASESVGKAFEVAFALIPAYLTITDRDRDDIILVAFWSTLALLGASFLIVAAQVPSKGLGRLSLPTGGPIVFGRYMVLMGMMAIAAAQRWKNGWAWAIVAVLSFVGVGLSGSRGPLLAWAVGIGAMVVCGLIAQNLQARAKVYSIGVAAAAGVIAFATVQSLGNKLTLINRLVDRESGGVYLSQRDTLVAEALQIWMRTPAQGTGLGTFSAAGGWHAYPHNLFMELLVDLGYIGLVLFLCMLWTYSKIFLTDKQAWTWVVPSLIACIAPVAVSGDFYDSRIVFAWPLLMAMFMAKQPAQVEQEPELSGELSLET